MLKKYIDVAAGRVKADIVLKNAAFLNTFTGKVEEGDIAIAGDRIAGIGSYDGVMEYDMSGLVVLPGFIDGHVHIESSMLTPEPFAELVVPRGTTTVIADPHEITNVCGMAGFEYMVKAADNTPLEVHFQLPSCVPATPFENSGATLAAKDIGAHICRSQVFGLGEFMNYPGVINCDDEAIKKLEAAHGFGKIVDGHAPCVTGSRLNAYICGGIATDHECSSPQELQHKADRGMYVMLRHSSSGQDFASNCAAVNAGNMRRFCICTDDRHAADLKYKGHIDDALRAAVSAGVDPVWAVTMATLNTAECYDLRWRGAIAPYRFADLAVVDNLKDFNVKYVFKDGVLVAEGGKQLFNVHHNRYIPGHITDTVHIRDLTADDFKLQLNGARARAIVPRPGTLITDCEVVDVNTAGGDVILHDDLLKLAVVERHKNTGNIGRGLLKGYGFKGGAMGITVAHDSHNIILLGDDNAAMAMAANTLKETGGGMVLVDSATGEVDHMILEVGGLMSARDADYVIEESDMLYKKAHSMGVKQGFAPFMTLAFLSLAVIPHLKLLDTGLFDVDKFAFTDIKAD